MNALVLIYNIISNFQNVVWRCIRTKKVVWQMPHQPYHCLCLHIAFEQILKFIRLMINLWVLFRKCSSWVGMKFMLGGRGCYFIKHQKMTKKLIHLLLKETKSLAISNKFMLSVWSLCVCNSMTWFSHSCVIVLLQLVYLMTHILELFHYVFDSVHAP